MKKLLILPLLLASCAQPTPTPVHPVNISYLGPLTITEQSEVTTVTTKSAAVFSWSDSRGLSATDNIYPNTPKTLPSGSLYGLSITLGE